MFKERLQGSKPNGLKSFLYHWKTIETQISKIGSHDPYGHLKHKLWPKEGNQPYFFACRWHAKYCWKALDEGYNFALDLISIRSLNAKLWAPKVAGVLILAISKIPLGSPKTKCHLDVGLVERRKVYYKGEGGGFPQVRTVVSLMSPSCSWLILTPKVLQLCTNYLVLVLCRPVWVSEAYQFFLVPSRSSNTPLYPCKMLRAKERALTPYFPIVFCLGLTFESLSDWERVKFHLTIQAVLLITTLFHYYFISLFLRRRRRFIYYCVFERFFYCCWWIGREWWWIRVNFNDLRNRDVKNLGQVPKKLLTVS
jgi:hypothetical protein